MRMHFAIALALGLVAGNAHAQDLTRSYEFDNVGGARVRCIVTQYNGVEERQIATTYSHSFEVDRSPTPQVWATSGCEAYVRGQTRVVSPQEQARRMGMVGKSPGYFGSGGLREQIVELMCADPKNASASECVAQGAR